MAQRRSTRASRTADGDEERTPYASRNTAPNMAPVVGVIAVIALAGIGFAVYSNSNKESEANESSSTSTQNANTGKDPFAHVAEEPMKTRTGGLSGGSTTSRSPENLLSDPGWLDRVRRGQEYIALHEEAQAALKAKDSDLWRSKGLQARDGCNALLEENFEWAVKQEDLYGDKDVRVRQIVATETKWESIVRKYKGI